MRKIIYLLVAAILCFGILFFVSAKVNHGHGPGWVNPESYRGHSERGEQGEHDELGVHDEHNERGDEHQPDTINKEM